MTNVRQGQPADSQKALVLKSISPAQWQRLSNGIFLYRINDDSKWQGRFAVRTIMNRGNVNYSDFATRDEAVSRLDELKNSFDLPIYEVQ